jgi:integrase
MAVQSTGRGLNTHLIKITVGYEQGTRKRLYYTETFKGTKKDARLREAELKIHHRDKKLVLSSKMTFHTCFEHYSDVARSLLSVNCFRIYESFIKRHLLHSIGDKMLRDLVQDDFQNVYHAMTSRGLSPLTVHSLHCAARAVITWALKKKLLSEDILKGVKLPKIPKPHPEFLTYEEMQAFFDFAPNFWYGNAFKFQFWTGLRNQELMALRWEDINFESATFCVKRACCWANGKFQGYKSTKTGEVRTLELGTPDLDLLKKLKAAQEAHIKSQKSRGLPYGDERLVFCTQDGRTPHMNAVRKGFKQILINIGITRRFRWYDARHTHATHMIDVDGANPKMISNRMGHSVKTLFHTYGHEMKGQQRKALSKISERVKL